MAFKVFLDANILLDLSLRRPQYEPAREIMTWIIQGRIQGFITPSIVHIVGYWLTKAYDQARAKDILISFLNDIIIIDIQHEQVISSLHSSVRDIEDALQYYTALHHKLDYFLSRDKQLRKEGISVLPVYTPEELIREINDRY